MGKGIAVKTIFELFVAAIILLILVPMLFGSFKEAWAAIMEGLGIVKPSNVEKAVLCSYYRCLEGCSSTRMDETKWTEGNEPVTCQKFCQLPKEWDCTNHPENCYSDAEFSIAENKWVSKNLKVCDDKSEKFPVNISLEKDETIEKSHLKDLMAKDLTCIIPSDAQGTTAFSEVLNSISSPLSALWNIIVFQFKLEWGRLVGSFEDNWLFVDSRLIKSRGSEARCTSSYGTAVTDSSLDELTVSGNKKIFIGTASFKLLNIRFTMTQLIPQQEQENLQCSQNKDKDKCEAANCQWCTNCVDNKANSFYEEICISNLDTCGYKKYCGCYSSESDCKADAECFWCTRFNQCINQAERQTKCPAEAD
jgi:hypothetical protein